MHRASRWLAVAGLWLLWGLFQSSRLRFEVPGIGWGRALQFGMPDAVIWALMTPVVVSLARRLPLRAGRVLPGLVLHLLVGTGLALLHAVLDMLFNVAVGALSGSPAGVGLLLLHLMKHGFHWNLVIYLAIVGITLYQQAERRAMELRTRLSEARLEALRLQLRPHFLFNTLHTIAGFMDQDPKRGRRVIRHLGELLRASLRPRSAEEIPLEEEIGLARAYLEIEQARFGERLRVILDIEPGALRCGVPALLLQPLVENAVRHGIEPVTGGGTLTIAARLAGRRLRISLTDDGAGMTAPEAGEGRQGIGLANTRARLQELYGAEHTFSVSAQLEGGVQVMIEMPARPMQPAAPRPAVAAAAGSGTS